VEIVCKGIPGTFLTFVINIVTIVGDKVESSWIFHMHEQIVS